MSARTPNSKRPSRRSSAAGASASSGAPRERKERSWATRFLRNLLLALIPTALLWFAMKPTYGRFLLAAGETAVRVTESPRVTRLLPREGDAAYIEKRDLPPTRRLVHAFKVADIHFHTILTAALFLATPGIAAARRFKNLGLALLGTFLLDVALLFFLVKSTYATGLGEWSLANYGDIARNLYGLSKHLLDLPFKLGLPFALWAAFYLSELPFAGPVPQETERKK